MELTSKTIKRIIQQNEDVAVQFGFAITHIFALGYKLDIFDEKKTQLLFEQQAEPLDVNQTRMKRIIDRLVQTQEYVKIEDLAEELFVSRATVDRLMPELKEIIQKYDLNLTYRPKYGIRLEGNEVNKRICYAHEVKGNSLYMGEEMMHKIQDILFTAIRKYNLVLNDINTNNLIQHCIIAINRVHSNNLVEEIQSMGVNDPIEKELDAAREIVKQFEKAFSIEMPKSEEQYIVMHLLGKRILSKTNIISEETLQCLDEIMLAIRSEKGVDFMGDDELKTTLALHLQPLLSRLKFGLKQDNPILLEIKREMNRGFELALCAADVIWDKYQYRVNEDEIGYLALHFAVALERMDKVSVEKKIVVVCTSGRGTAKLIEHRLTTRYHFKPENLIVVSSFMIDTIDLDDVACILTMVPLQGDFRVPVVMIDMSLSQQSFDRVDKVLESIHFSKEVEALIDERLFFPDQHFADRNEILSFLCGQVMKYHDVGETLEDDVMKREELSSTEVGNQVALPHPYKYDGDQILLCFLSLKKPVKWKYENVRLVILMLLPSKESKTANELSGFIAQLVSDTTSVQKVLTDLSKKTLIEMVM